MNEQTTEAPTEEIIEEQVVVEVSPEELTMRQELEQRGVQPNVIDDIIKVSTLTPEEFKVEDARILEDAFKISDIFGGGYDLLPEPHKQMMLSNCIRLYSTVTTLLTKAREEFTQH